MNNREYSWGQDELTKFLDDLIDTYEEGKYVLKMGSIINLKYNDGNYIYDGQQRTLTTILMMYCLSLLEPKLKDKIVNLLTVDEIDELTAEQKIIKSEYAAEIIPKMYCVNPHDMKALVDIFNGKVELYINYVCAHNSIDLDEDDDYNEYKCNICSADTKVVKVARKIDFIRHITKQHGFRAPSGISKLYSAFEYMYNYFVNKKYDRDKIIKLYQFIISDIDIQFYDCCDPVYVSRIFDWENNRGRNVACLDLIKNPILVKIPNDKKIEVYNRWEELKNYQTTNSHVKNIGQKMFDVAIQIYNNHVQRAINKEELFKPIIDAANTHDELLKFFAIVRYLYEIIDKISNHKFGRLLTNSPKVCLDWEAFMWCLLPIFYTKKTIDDKLIVLFTKWYFRQCGTKARGFNNLCYSSEFIRITNCFLQDNAFDYYVEFEKCLQKNIDKSINSANYEDTVRELAFKSTSATHLLMFLETCENPDIHTVPLDYTLEHIVPQKNKDTLTDCSLMHRIGNLTLLEGKNSANSHKGNCSLGSKDYDKKIESYRESSCKITRSVAEVYKEFGEIQIVARSNYTIKRLNKLTQY